MDILIVCTAIACAAMGGVFFAFSSFVMQALKRLPPQAYLIGTIAVTMVFNVPLNNALAAASPASSDAVWLWTKYARTWTAWNHVRTISGLVAASLLTIAIVR